MSTSLAEQLRRLAAPQTSILHDSTKRPSILFDPKEAAEKDRQTIYEIGYQGLMELVALNPAFLQFEQTLFDRSSMTFERSVESSEVNKRLNKTIQRFFHHLSPYFMLKPAHMCIEWLLRRYHIDQFNKQEMLQLIFPYHETKMFVRCVQVLKLKQANDGWKWLRAIKRPGVPLSRSAVLNRAASDPAFLKFICESTIAAVKELDTKANTLQAQFAFYTTSVVGALEYANEIAEWHIHTILASVLKGMSSKTVDFCAAAYMVAAQLVSKTRLSTKLLQALLSKISEVEHARLHRAAVSLLVLIYQKQAENVPALSNETLKSLTMHDWLPATIDALAQQGAIVSCFCNPLVGGCLQNVQQKENNWQDFKAFVDNFLLVVHLRGHEASNLIRCVLDNYSNPKPSPIPNGDAVIEIDSDDDDLMLDGDVKSWYSEVLKQLEQQHPEEFESVLKETMQGREEISEARKQALKAALAFRLKSLYSEDNAAVYENLYHYNTRNRAEAVKFLVKNFDKLSLAKDDTILKDSLLDRLSDDEPKVLNEVLKLPTEAMINLLGPNETVMKLTEILYKRKSKSQTWGNITISVLEHLLKRPLLQQSDVNRILLIIIPLLLPITQQDFTIAKQILSSELVGAVPSLKGLKMKILNLEDAEQAAGIIEQALLTLNMRISVAELLKSFTDARDSISLMVLLVGAFPRGSSEEVGLEAVKKVLNVSRNCKLVLHAGEVKWYHKVAKNEIPLQVLLNCLQTIAERTKYQMPQDLANKGVAIIIFEFLLSKSFASTQKEGKAEYTAALRSIMNTIFPSLEAKLEFLANYFIQDCGSELDEGLETKMRAIRLFSVIAANKKSSAHLKIESFVKLLVALSDKIDLVRECALKALEALWQEDLLPSGFDHLAQSLLERHDEIILEDEQLPLILFTIIVGGNGDKKMGKVLDDLVKTAADDATCDSLKSKILNVLKHINNAHVLKKLLALGLKTLDYVEKMDENAIVLDGARSSILHHIICRYDHSTIKVINEEANAWNFVKKLLKCQRIRSSYEDKPISIASTLMNTFNETLYSKLSERLKREFIDEVVTALTFADDASLTSMGNKLMKRICLNAKYLEPVLVSMKLVCNASSPEKHKKNKHRTLNSEAFNSISWRKGITLLELLQNKKTIDGLASLIAPLVEILRVCLEFEEQSNFEYAKQLVLSALLQCCQQLVEDRAALKKFQENTFRMDLVVQCIRASPNPQTHHHALLLLSQCASLFPDQVLHNIMDIFTFMGSTVVRHDDAFSFQIITRIIESIVPTLVSMKVNEAQVTRVVSVMRVFSDIALDVPEHRRLPLYAKLMRTLDAKKFLWMFLCILLEAHVIHDETKSSTQHKYSENSSEMPKRVAFCLQLLKDFDVETVLETCIALFEYVRTLPANKTNSKPATDIATDESVLFDCSVHSAKQLRHFKYVVVQVVSSFTSSTEFINQVAALREEESKAMKPFYQEFIIKVLCYVPHVTNAMEQHSNANQLQYWKVMLHHCYDVLENAISLLSPDMLLIVVQGLMQHKLPTVRKKVIEILISKLQNKSNYFEDCKDEYLLNVLQPLNDLLDSILEQQASQNEMQYIQQSALIAIKLLSKTLAEKHVAAFKELMWKLTRVLKRHKSVPKVILAAVVLAITEISANLRAHAISQLSKFMPYIVEVLQEQSTSLQEQLPDNVCIAIVTGVQKLFDTLPLFLGPYMVDTISALVGIWVQLERHRDESRATIVVNKLNAIWTKIASTVPLRINLSVFDKTYKKLIEEERFFEINFLMKLTNECVARASSEDIHSMQNEIGQFYLDVFDFRVQNIGRTNQKNINLVEESVLESFVSLVLKLSESSFRPLYQKVYDWAMRKNEEKERTITYFLLSAKIADALKSLYVLFASDIVKDAAGLLDKCNSSKVDSDLYFPDDDEKNTLLVENILKTLRRIFLYDSKNFVDEHRFDILMQPIVDQLQNRLVLEKESMKELLQSCISELARTVHNDTLWKRLNYQILLKTRSNIADVRIVAFNCCVGIARKLGEQFTPLLPETVPFIAELFEDEVEIVEKTCRRGAQEIEKSLGISLQEYF